MGGASKEDWVGGKGSSVVGEQEADLLPFGAQVQDTNQAEGPGMLSTAQCRALVHLGLCRTAAQSPLTQGVWSKFPVIHSQPPQSTARAYTAVAQQAQQQAFRVSA